MKHLTILLLAVLALSSQVVRIEATEHSRFGVSVKNQFRKAIHHISPSEKARTCTSLKTFQLQGTEGGEPQVCEFMFLGYHATEAKKIKDMERGLLVDDSETIDEAAAKKLGSGFYVTDTKHEAFKMLPEARDPALCAVYVPILPFRNWNKMFIPPQIEVYNQQTHRTSKARLWNNRVKIDKYTSILSGVESSDTVLVSMNYGFVEKDSDPKASTMTMNIPETLLSQVKVECLPKVLTKKWPEGNRWFEQIYYKGPRHGGFSVQNAKSPVVRFIKQDDGQLIPDRPESQPTDSRTDRPLARGSADSNVDGGF
ncbi:hypothetical protein BKA69DRAFT_1078581 [Paraphysoderma sedebokerense]|nr:hypothetical protein BKA69DRAFT_1078581 [Paraphysoderma sedebokerense]